MELAQDHFKWRACCSATIGPTARYHTQSSILVATHRAIGFGTDGHFGSVFPAIILRPAVGCVEPPTTQVLSLQSTYLTVLLTVLLIYQNSLNCFMSGIHTVRVHCESGRLLVIQCRCSEGSPDLLLLLNSQVTRTVSLCSWTNCLALHC